MLAIKNKLGSSAWRKPQGIYGYREKYEMGCQDGVSCRVLIGNQLFTIIIISVISVS